MSILMSSLSTLAEGPSGGRGWDAKLRVVPSKTQTGRKRARFGGLFCHSMGKASLLLVVRPGAPHVASLLLLVLVFLIPKDY